MAKSAKKRETKKSGKKKIAVSAPRDFSPQKMRIALQGFGARMRAENFALGLPITVLQNGNVVRIYADGREEILERLNIQRTKAPKGWIKI